MKSRSPWLLSELTFWLLAAICSLQPLTVHALGQRAPVLFTIDYINPSGRSQAKVSLLEGLVVSPYQGQAQRRIEIHSGSEIHAEQRPPDRLVRLYRGIDKQRLQLGVIKVRYYREANGRWRPRYVLHQEPIFVPDGRGGWRPALAPMAGTGLLMQTGNASPNAEGYFRKLQFGLTTGSLYVDAWEAF